jgi:hypothetical protein
MVEINFIEFEICLIEQRWENQQTRNFPRFEKTIERSILIYRNFHLSDSIFLGFFETMKNKWIHINFNSSLGDFLEVEFVEIELFLFLYLVDKSSLGGF